MKLLNMNMSATRAKNLFQILDVSGDGAIEYEEFLAAFRPTVTNYDYDLEEAIFQAGRHADLIVTLIDPKAVHYNARELHAYKRLFDNFASKLKLACFVSDKVRAEPKLKSHLLRETHARLERVIGLEPGRLPELATIYIPKARAEEQATDAIILENRMPEARPSSLRALAALHSLHSSLLH